MAQSNTRKPSRCLEVRSGKGAAFLRNVPAANNVLEPTNVNSVRTREILKYSAKQWDVDDFLRRHNYLEDAFDIASAKKAIEFLCDRDEASHLRFKLWKQLF